jgi:hypothetical protein
MMLGLVGAVIFAVAFVIAATSTATDAVFAPDTLLLAGLDCRAAAPVAAPRAAAPAADRHEPANPPIPLPAGPTHR